MQPHVLLDVQYLLEAEAEAGWILVGLRLRLMLCILGLFCYTCRKQQIEVSKDIILAVWDLMSRDGTVVRAIALHQCGLVSILAWYYMWIEFVVGCPLALCIFL